MASALLGITPTAGQDFPSRPPWLIIPYPIRHGKVLEHLLGYGYQAAIVKHRRDTKKVRTIAENKVRRRHGQRLLLDAAIQSVRIERDQPRLGCTIYPTELDA